MCYLTTYKFTCVLALALCSTRAVPLDGASRISNGNIANASEFRYAISLQQLGTAQQLVTRGHVCGGVLITYQHVLTAGNCVVENLVNGTQVLITPSAYRVFAGANLLTDDASVDRVRTIANITLHPQYIGYPALVNSIAIITLLSPFSNATVVPLSLPAATFNPADFSLCNVAGWGASNLTATASTELKYATKYIYNQELCTAIYNREPGVANIFSSMVCAASYDIISSGCTGDLGNALVCNGELTGVLTLSGMCASSSFPEVYTRVSNYTEWIRSVTGSAPAFPPSLTLFVFFTILQTIRIVFSHL